MSDSLYKSDCLRLWEMNQSSNHYCFSLRQKLSTFEKKPPQDGNLFRVISGKKVTKLWKYQVFITKVNHYYTTGLQIMQIHLVQNSTSANFSQSQKLHYVRTWCMSQLDWELTNWVSQFYWTIPLSYGNTQLFVDT